MSFCPAFWGWLTRANNSGVVISVEQVSAQVRAQDPDLTNWLRANVPSLFASVDQQTLDLVPDVINHVNAGVIHTDAAKAAFIDSIYPFLIAYAKAHGRSVVTLERSAPNDRDVVRLPDICRELGIESMDTFEMLRRERPSFVLA